MQVDIYIVDTRNIDISFMYNYLSDVDLKDLQRYQVEEVKKEKTASKYLKNKYIGEYSFNEFGKPISKNLFFNISHSHGLVVLAINKDREIGIDIELVKLAPEDLRQYISSSIEREYIKDDESFAKIWTSKESLLKAIGTGINTKINTVPALPVDGVREYLNEKYYSHCIKIDDYICSITLKGKEDFNIKIMEDR